MHYVTGVIPHHAVEKMSVQNPRLIIESHRGVQYFYLSERPACELCKENLMNYVGFMVINGQIEYGNYHMLCIDCIAANLDHVIGISMCRLNCYSLPIVFQLEWDDLCYQGKSLKPSGIVFPQTPSLEEMMQEK